MLILILILASKLWQPNNQDIIITLSVLIFSTKLSFSCSKSSTPISII